MSMTRLSIRVQFDNGSALGPGKVQLMEQVAETGDGQLLRAGFGDNVNVRRKGVLQPAARRRQNKQRTSSREANERTRAH